MKSGEGGGNIFYYVIKNVAPPLFRSYDLGGSGGMPPPEIFLVFVL